MNIRRAVCVRISVQSAFNAQRALRVDSTIARLSRTIFVCACAENHIHQKAISALKENAKKAGADGTAAQRRRIIISFVGRVYRAYIRGGNVGRRASRRHRIRGVRVVPV